MSTRTRAGLRKVRPVGPGSRVQLVAPASPFDRADFDAGLAELRRLDLEPVFDARVFERQDYVAGSAASRVAQLVEAWRRPDIDLLLAVRGGYGCIQMLPLLSSAALTGDAPAGVCGYSDITSLHVWLGCHAGVASIHGPMVDRRLAVGPAAYDAVTFLRSVSSTPLGELTPEGLEPLVRGEAAGPLFGGTLTQLLASLGTPFAFDPPQGYVLFLDEVGERPYRLDRMLVQAQQAGLLARASAVIVGQLPRCDEPDGTITARRVVAETLKEFPGPVLFGFPSGHTTTPLVTLPFGVHTRVVAGARPAVVVEESPVLGSQP